MISYEPKPEVDDDGVMCQSQRWALADGMFSSGSKAKMGKGGWNNFKFVNGEDGWWRMK